MKQDEAILEKKINLFPTASSVREVVVKFSKSLVPEVNPFYLINRQIFNTKSGDTYNNGPYKHNWP